MYFFVEIYGFSLASYYYSCQENDLDMNHAESRVASDFV